MFRLIWTGFCLEVFCLCYVLSLPIQQSDIKDGGHSRHKRSVNIYIYPGQSSNVTLIFNSPSSDHMKLATVKTHHVQNVEIGNQTFKLGHKKHLAHKFNSSRLSKQQKSKEHHHNDNHRILKQSRESSSFDRPDKNHLSLEERFLNPHTSNHTLVKTFEVNKYLNGSQVTENRRHFNDSVSGDSLTIGHDKINKLVSESSIGNPTNLSKSIYNVTALSTPLEVPAIKQTSEAVDHSSKHSFSKAFSMNHDASGNNQTNSQILGKNESDETSVTNTSSAENSHSKGQTFLNQTLIDASTYNHIQNKSLIKSIPQKNSAKNNSLRLDHFSNQDIPERELTEINSTIGGKSSSENVEEDFSNKNYLRNAALTVRNSSEPKTLFTADELSTAPTLIKHPLTSVTLDNHSKISSPEIYHTSLGTLAIGNVSELNKDQSNQLYLKHSLMERVSGVGNKNNSRSQDQVSPSEKYVSNTSLALKEILPNQTFREQLLNIHLKDGSNEQDQSNTADLRSLEVLDMKTRSKFNKNSQNQSSAEEPFVENTSAEDKTNNYTIFQISSLDNSSVQNVSNASLLVGEHSTHFTFTTNPLPINPKNYSSQTHSITVQPTDLITSASEKAFEGNKNLTNQFVVDRALIQHISAEDNERHSQILDKSAETLSSNMSLLKGEKSSDQTFTEVPLVKIHGQNLTAQYKFIEAPTAGESSETNEYSSRPFVANTSVGEKENHSRIFEEGTFTNGNVRLEDKDDLPDHSIVQQPLPVIKENNRNNLSYEHDHLDAGLISEASKHDTYQSVLGRSSIENLSESHRSNYSQSQETSKYNESGASTRLLPKEEVLLSQTITETPLTLLTAGKDSQDHFIANESNKNVSAESQSLKMYENSPNNSFPDISMTENYSVGILGDENYSPPKIQNERFNERDDALILTKKSFQGHASTQQPFEIYSNGRSSQNNSLILELNHPGASSTEAMYNENETLSNLKISKHNITSIKLDNENKDYFQKHVPMKLDDDLGASFQSTEDSRVPNTIIDVPSVEMPVAIVTQNHSQVLKEVKSPGNFEQNVFTTLEGRQNDHQEPLNQVDIEQIMSPQKVKSETGTAELSTLPNLEQHISDDSFTENYQNKSLSAHQSDTSKAHLSGRPSIESQHTANHALEENTSNENDQNSKIKSHVGEEDSPTSNTPLTGTPLEITKQNEMLMNKDYETSKTEDHSAAEHNESNDPVHHETILERLAILKHLLSNVHSHEDHHKSGDALEEILSQIINSVPPAPKTNQNSQLVNDPADFEPKSTAKSTISNSGKFSIPSLKHPLEQDFRGPHPRKARPVKHSLQHIATRIKQQETHPQRRMDSEELWK